jgi:hypothetical protein
MPVPQSAGCKALPKVLIYWKASINKASRAESLIAEYPKEVRRVGSASEN